MSYGEAVPTNEFRRILVVRLGAMGDIIHALPAVTRLKCSFPRARITWAIESRWAPLLDDNPYVDSVLPLVISKWRRAPWNLATWVKFRDSRRQLRAGRFDLAVDFQGLFKSAMVTYLSRADRVYGFERDMVRERIAASFYSNRVASHSAHVVQQNLDLATAVGGTTGPIVFPLPDGKPEASLPHGDYVLTSPVAGWASKQWPPEHYAELARLLWREKGLPLVIDCAPAHRSYGEQIVNQAPTGSCLLHVSSLEGLLAATRRAKAVVGVDSGPLHLAAALQIPGVAIFGQTDPARNGPYGSSFKVLRASGVVTSYKRRDQIDSCMLVIQPEQVWGALQEQLMKRTRVETAVGRRVSP